MSTAESSDILADAISDNGAFSYLTFGGVSGFADSDPRPAASMDGRAIGSGPIPPGPENRTVECLKCNTPKKTTAKELRLVCKCSIGQHRRWRVLQDGDAPNNDDAGPSRKRPCPGTPPVTTPPSTPPQPSQLLLPISPVNPEPISADIPQPPPEQPAPQPNVAPVPAPCTWILEAYGVTRPDDYEIEVIVHKRKGETIYSHLYSKADGVKEQYPGADGTSARPWVHPHYRAVN